MRLRNCHQRELSLHITVILHTSIYSDENRTEIWCILRNYLCSRNLERFGKSSRLLSLSHHKWVSKTTFTCLYCTHYDTLSTYHSAYFSENYHTSLKEYYHWYLLCLIHTIFLRPHIFDAKKKCSLAGKLRIHLWGKTNITRHYCNQNNIYYTHHCIRHTQLRYRIKNIFFNGNYKLTLHSHIRSTYSDANKTTMSWCLLT